MDSTSTSSSFTSGIPLLHSSQSLQLQQQQQQSSTSSIAIPSTSATLHHQNNNNIINMMSSSSPSSSYVELQQPQMQQQQQINQQQQFYGGPNLNHHHQLQTLMNGNNNSNSCSTNNEIQEEFNGRNNSNTNNKYSKNIKSTDSLNSQQNLDDWLENCLKDSPPIISSIPHLQSTYNTDLMDNNQHQQQHGSNYGLPSSHMIQHPPQNMYRSNNHNIRPTISVNNYSSPTFKPHISEPSSFYNFLNPTLLEKNLNMLQVSMNQTQDYASLPPLLNNNNNHIDSTATTSNHYQQDNLLNVEYNQSRRFSDPGLGGNSDNENDNDSQKDENCTKHIQNNGGGGGGDGNNSKLLSSLLEQINLLHDTNTKICRNLHETKVEIEALKHSPSWGLRHRRDSVSGLSTHSQPLGYAFGTQSPAPTYHSGMYTPGMLTDVVREVREAARIREEALLNRVKALVDERSWNLNENNFRLMRELEGLKIQFQQMKTERKESNMKINKLEEEVKILKSFLSHSLTNSRHNFLNSLPNRSQLDSNHQKYNRSVNNNHKRNINYGVINHDDGYNLHNLSDSETVLKTPNNNTDEINFNSSTFEENSNSNHNKSFGNEFQLEKDTLELRRELQDAIASRKQANNRIVALEQMVNTLQNKVPTSSPIQTNLNSTYDNQTYFNRSTSSPLSLMSSSSPPVLKIVESTIKKSSSTPPIEQPQVAVQIHNVSPKQTRKKHSKHHQQSNNVSLKGPVTDL